jgi:membrane dipeptidase
MRPRTCLLALSVLTATPLLGQQAGGARSVPDGCDEKLWAHALQVHDAALVIDTHSDTTSRMLDEGFDMGHRASDGHMDLPRIAEGGLDAQFYAIYVASRYFGTEDMSSAKALANSKPNASARRAFDMIDAFYREVERHPDRMVACFSATDVEHAVAAGKHAALMGIEGGHAIEGDLRLLRMFWQLGVRYMTLTHSNHNHFADSSGETPPRWGGLNQLGVKVVREMNRLGMMVDVSHVSDETFFEVLGATRAPVICSHSSARALCGNRRNVTDEMLEVLAKNGGVCMVNFNCGFLSEEYDIAEQAWNTRVRLRERAIEAKHPRGTPEFAEASGKLRAQNPIPEPIPLSILIDHIEHMIDVAGVDHVGLGSDFDGVNCVPHGIDDVSHLPRITYELLARGHSEQDCRKILGQNLLRVFAAVENTARALAGEPPYQNGPDDFEH